MRGSHIFLLLERGWEVIERKASNCHHNVDYVKKAGEISKKDWDYYSKNKYGGAGRPFPNQLLMERITILLLEEHEWLIPF